MPPFKTLKGDFELTRGAGSPISLHSRARSTLFRAPKSPSWYFNIVANPEVTLAVGTEKFKAKAPVVEGAERDRLYAAQAEEMPAFKEYEAKTTRKIPVVVLARG